MFRTSLLLFSIVFSRLTWSQPLVNIFEPESSISSNELARVVDGGDLQRLRLNDIDLLTKLNVNDRVSFNLTENRLTGKVISKEIGQFGAQTVFVVSDNQAINSLSAMTISQHGVFMALFTEHGEIRLSGGHREVELKVPPMSHHHHDGISPLDKTTHEKRKLEAQKLAKTQTSKNRTGATQAPGTSDSSKLELLMVYSSDALPDMNNDPEGFFDHQVNWLNFAFQQSGIELRTRVTATYFIEGDFSDPLSVVINSAYGYPPFEGVAKERAKFGADAVVTFIDADRNRGVGGAAFANDFFINSQINRYSTESYEWMYAAVDSGARINVFAHEIGHILGLMHARQQGSNDNESGATFDYGRGYRVPLPDNKGIATIMAYPTQSTVTVPVFSNPENLCGAVPCGVSAENSSYDRGNRSNQQFASNATKAVNQIREIAVSMAPQSPPQIPISDAMAALQDNALRQCVQAQLNQHPTFTLANELISIQCFNYDIESLTGISQFVGLKDIQLYDVQLTDINELSSLTALSKLVIQNKTQFEVEALKGLHVLLNRPALRLLTLNNVNLTDQQLDTFLPGLVNLYTLSLRTNALTQIPDVSNNIHLTNLYLNGNEITNTTNITTLRTIRELDISNTSVSTFPDESFDLPWLFRLSCRHNQLTALGGLIAPHLSILEASNNNIESIASLPELPELRDLELDNNPVNSIAGLSRFERLQKLSLNNNPLSSIETFPEFNDLTYLSLANTEISSVDFASGLARLKHLNVLNNSISSVSGLSGLLRLDTLLLAGNENLSFESWPEFPSLSMLSLSHIAIDNLDFLTSAVSLTSLSVSESILLKDISGIFELPHLESLLWYYRSDFYDPRPYCWQMAYLRTTPTRAWRNFQLYESERCNTEDDNNDFDNDGVSNIEELALGSDPTNDETGELKVRLVNTARYVDENSTQPATFGIVRSGPVQNEVTISVTTEDGSAQAHLDYEPVDEIVTLASGERFKVFPVTVFGDFEGKEPDESFTVKFESTGTLAFNAQATATINSELGAEFNYDRSELPYLEFEKRFHKAKEGETVSLIINRTDNVPKPANVVLQWSALSTGADKFFENEIAEVNFSAGETSKTIDIPTTEFEEFDNTAYMSLKMVSRQDPFDPEFQVIANHELDELVIIVEDKLRDEKDHYNQTGRNRHVPFDFDWDYKADIGVRRASNATWYVKNSFGLDPHNSNNDDITRTQFGLRTSDIALPADYDGDGRTDFAVRRPGTSTWYVLNSAGVDGLTRFEDGITRLRFGLQADDIPVPADYDGDGRVDIAVRRPENNTWYIKNSGFSDLITENNDGITRLVFGRRSEDIPVPADYDGDGLVDIAVRRPSTSTWYIRNSSGIDNVTNHPDGITRIVFGRISNDIPVTGDFDGDGKADIAVRRQSNHTWYIRNSSGVDVLTGNKDGITRLVFGRRNEDIPVPADYDGDGLTDIAVRRPSNHYWYINNSSGTDYLTGYNDGISRLVFGRQSNDIPFAAPLYLRMKPIANWPGQSTNAEIIEDIETPEQWLLLPQSCKQLCVEERPSENLY